MNTIDLSPVYVVLKLKTGETILATIVGEKEGVFSFADPFQIIDQTRSDGNTIVYKSGIMPYCPWSASRTFCISTLEVQHINQMNQKALGMYLSLLSGDEAPPSESDDEDEFNREDQLSSGRNRMH